MTSASAHCGIRASEPGYPYGASVTAGKGGDGIFSSISGSAVIRAGGGGGSSVSAGGGAFGGAGGGGRGGGGAGGDNISGGTINTGGGSGGMSSAVTASGGSGIVILRYPINVTATFSSGVTQSTSFINNFKVSIITATSTTSETVTFS